MFFYPKKPEKTLVLLMLPQINPNRYTLNTFYIG